MKTLIGLLGAVSLLSLTDAYRMILPKPPPTPKVYPCQYNYDPVCGSDGVTYINKCILEFTSQENVKSGLSKISVVEDCECRNSCNCQNVDLPVCTLDGQTYPNECELACENIKRIANKKSIIYLAYRTACRGPSGRCSDIAAPVCGSDNVLYRNRCVLDYTNAYDTNQGLPAITVKNNGACQDGYLCPITKQPVCASDGNYYNNPCELEAENERLRCYEETTTLQEVDPSVCEACSCPIDNSPVCGNDDITYPNLCQLNCTILRQNKPSLKAMYKGECQICECKEEYRPVCGTDRKTYDSSCLLECQNIGRSEELPPLSVFHVGECQQFVCDCTYCGDKYQPMCGNDGQTYWNLCWLQCNDKCCRKNGQSAVYLSKRGSC